MTIAGVRRRLDKDAAAICETDPAAHVLETQATEAAVQTTLERFSRLDILIADAVAMPNVTQGTWINKELRSSW